MPDTSSLRPAKSTFRLLPSGGNGSDSPRVAVAIVNFNGGDHLRKCLQALDCQTRRPDRVIIVDNASHDDSLSGAAALYPEVEIVQAGRNLGFAAGNNLAIRMATDCDYVALLNADAYAEPDWLAQLLTAAAQHPQDRFFTSRLVSADDPSILDGTGDVYHVSGRVWRRDWRCPDVGRPSELPTLAACAAAAMYSRSAFEEVGAFDEDYFCYMEDVDLGFRLQLAGYTCRYVPEAVAHHVGSVTTVRHSDFYLYHGHRNLVWTYVKNMPGRLFWLYLPQHVFLNLLTLVWFTLRGRGRVIFRAKWHALRGLPRMWNKRRTIQRGRRATVRQIRSLLVGGMLRAVASWYRTAATTPTRAKNDCNEKTA